MIPDKTWLIAGARMFALGAHIAVGQQRKYTGEPYWHHLAEVADLVSRHTDNSPTQVAAAWLHDVLEDTAVSACDIERLFGPEVAGLVVGLTDVSTPADGNRSSRKALDLQHIARQSPGCKTIKLADLISNVSTVASRDPEFARVYLAEKRQLLEVLQEGNAELLKMATAIVSLGLQEWILPECIAPSIQSSNGAVTPLGARKNAMSKGDNRIA